MTQYIPQLLRIAMQQRKWPRGRIPGSAYQSLKLRPQPDLELTPELGLIVSDTSGIAALGFLIERFDFQRQPQCEWHLYHGSTCPDNRDLPWLDLERSTVIGGGADHGDDLWLVLDMRHNTEDPRVVYNVFSSSNHATWHELSASLSSFLQTANAAKSPWWKVW